MDCQHLEDIFQFPKSKEIHKTIIDKTYLHCNTDICSFQGGQHKSSRIPKHLILTYDRGCNLQCPSCRKDFILHTPESENISSHLNELLGRITDEITLTVTGSGDPFGSRVFRDFLYNMHHDHVRINLQTNGLLLKKSWDKINKNSVQQIRISFDAATKETYYKTRYPGDFDHLMENVRFIAEQRKTHAFRLMSDFVVQQDNYKEMKQYIEILLDYEFDSIAFSRIEQWSMPEDEFNRKAVWKPEHPEFNEYCAILEDEIFDHPKVFSALKT